MAHFAKLDENNTVLEVHVVNNNELIVEKITEDSAGCVTVTTVESEEKGIQFLTEWSGGYTNWKQTSYNGNFRGKYAAIGDVYDTDANVFSSPVVANSPDVPVVAPAVETEQAVVLETAQIDALTTEQISGLE